MSCAKKGRLDLAVRRYRRAVKLKPDSPEALMNFGITLSDLGEFDEALNSLRESLRLGPDSPDCLVNLGMTFARQGNWDEALAVTNRLSTCVPISPRHAGIVPTSGWLAATSSAAGRSTNGGSSARSCACCQ